MPEVSDDRAALMAAINLKRLPTTADSDKLKLSSNPKLTTETVPKGSPSSKPVNVPHPTRPQTIAEEGHEFDALQPSKSIEAPTEGPSASAAALMAAMKKGGGPKRVASIETKPSTTKASAPSAKVPPPKAHPGTPQKHEGPSACAAAIMNARKTGEFEKAGKTPIPKKPPRDKTDWMSPHAAAIARSVRDGTFHTLAKKPVSKRPPPPEKPKPIGFGSSPKKAPPTAKKPKPEPVKEKPKPEPVKVVPKPEPIKEAPKPEPIKEAPKPEPIKEAPKPEPIKEAPKPEPIKEAPKPEPVKEVRKVEEKKTVQLPPEAFSATPVETPKSARSQSTTRIRSASLLHRDLAKPTADPSNQRPVPKYVSSPVESGGKSSSQKTAVRTSKPSQSSQNLSEETTPEKKERKHRKHRTSSKRSTDPKFAIEGPFDERVIVGEKGQKVTYDKSGKYQTLNSADEISAAFNRLACKINE